jgi:putative ABC transport system permease protein
LIDSLYIAWKYVTFNKVKTTILVTSITLIAFLPLALQVLLNASEQQLRARAGETPLLVGARGSALDLVMNSLYFSDNVSQLISMRAAEQIDDSGLAVSIPLYVRFHARGFPVVGTSLDYFDFRRLEIKQGRMLAMLGECVIGADVAERLGLGANDSLISSPENLFDIAGVYPLKMKVTGVLARSHSADDAAVFVDTRTAWVMQGLGHGHEDVTRTRDSSVVLQRNERNVTANAKLLHYTEISEANLGSFHFHGDEKDHPLTAVISLPQDTKSATLLRGHYLEDKQYQITRPDDVIDSLMENIFRIKSVIDAVIVIVGFATVLTLLLVFVLSLRLRQGEIDTIFRIGCSRMTVARLLAAEILIIAVVSAGLCAALLWLVQANSNELVRSLILR